MKSNQPRFSVKDENTISIDSNDTILFISDVHLEGFSSDENEAIERDLTEVLHWANDQKYVLVVVGDLFDYWMEYPNARYPTVFSPILRQLALYSSPKFMITGNHDNWDFGLFDSLFDVCVSEFLKIHHVASVFAFHGDGFSGDGYGFRRKWMHRLLRHPYFVNVYQTLLNPERGWAAMKWFSLRNRELDERIPSPHGKIASWVKTQEHFDADLFIAGHEHIRQNEHFSRGHYLNLGCFYKSRDVAILQNKRLTLGNWKNQRFETATSVQL